VTNGLTDGCDRIHCRARRAGLGPAPWTPEQWALISPPADFTASDPVKTDPDVIAAEQQRDEARAVYDVADEVWMRAARAHADSEMRRRLRPDQMRPLVVARDEADMVRERAWKKVTAANMAIAKAQAAARYRLEHAEANAVEVS
jgi:hypothetical protein